MGAGGAGGVDAQTGFRGGSSSFGGTTAFGGGGGGSSGQGPTSGGSGGGGGGGSGNGVNFTSTGGAGGTAGDLGGTGSISNAGTLAFNRSDAVTLSRAITGSGSLTKSGVGNLILTGSSNHTGPTSVAGGRLSVNGALGNSPVTVLALAELGGSGSITGPVSVASGGTLSPGNSIASLVTGSTSFASGATFEYEVDSTDLNALATAADLLVVNGNLDIASGSLLTFTDLDLTPNAFVEDTTIFAMINYSGAWNSGLFTYNGNELADGERFLVGSQLWEIDYNRTSATGLDNFTGDYLPNSSFVAITAVPEPSTLMLLGLGGAGALACQLRRSRRITARLRCEA